MTHGKTYNKSPRRINHKATKSKTNTRTTALERSVEQTTVGVKALLQLANFTNLICTVVKYGETFYGRHRHQNQLQLGNKNCKMLPLETKNTLHCKIPDQTADQRNQVRTSAVSRAVS